MTGHATAAECPPAAQADMAAQIAATADLLAAAGLELAATSCWPEHPEDRTPAPVAGFIVSSFSPLVAEVADRCLVRHYGQPPADPIQAERTAVVIASGGGDLVTATAVARAVDAGHRVAPLFFFQAVPNAVAGHVAARWGLAGPVVCLGTGGEHLAEGLAEAALLIEDGDADEALIVWAEQAEHGDRAIAMLVRPACAADRPSRPNRGVQP